MTDLTVRELKQAEWDHWDQWLALQPWGSPFSAAWWLDANCRAFGGHPLLLGVLDGEQLVGGVALRIMDVGPAHMVRSSMLYNPDRDCRGKRRRADREFLEHFLRTWLVEGSSYHPSPVLLTWWICARLSGITGT